MFEEELKKIAEEIKSGEYLNNFTEEEIEHCKIVLYASNNIIKFFTWLSENYPEYKDVEMNHKRSYELVEIHGKEFYQYDNRKEGLEKLLDE